MSTSDISETDLDLFIKMGKKAADAAAEVIVHHYSSCRRLHFTNKDGEGPVTEAEKEAEETIVSILLNSFPSHAVLGEETKWRSKDTDAVIPDFVWLVDPIDGTDSFIGRRFEFGILIALLYKGKPMLGIIDQPITKDRWIGVWGRKTTKNGREVSACSLCKDFNDARVDVKSRHYSDDAEFAFDRIVPNVREILHDGNCIAYGMLASGYVDLVVDCGLDCYDFLALIPIVEGAGGVITDWEGRELNWNVSPHTYTIPGGYRVLAAGNKVLHERALLALLLN